MQRYAKTNEVSVCNNSLTLSARRTFGTVGALQRRLARRLTHNRNFKMTVEQHHDGLRHIQKLLQGCGVSLKIFHLPEPPAVDADAKYQGELLAERQYDRKALAESSAKV